MTAYETLAIDFDAIDTHYADTVTLVSTDWRADEDYVKFVAALKASVRGPLGVISTNDVRLLLLEDTVNGPRCSIEHHRYSSLWSRAKSEGLIDIYWRDGQPVLELITTSPTGNNGKWIPMRVWTG